VSPHHRLLNTVRDTRKTLYFVTGIYVAIGLLLAIFAAVNGNLMGTLVGLVISSGAMLAATLFRTLYRVGLRVSEIGEHLDEVRQRLRQMTEHSGAGTGASGALAGAAVKDIARDAHGDPSLITAATLSRATYPRLVTAMEAQPPAHCDSAPPDEVAVATMMGTPHAADADTRAAGRDYEPMQTWNAALLDDDYATCRAMYAILVDTVEPRAVVQLGEQLEALARRTEESLRVRFGEAVRNRDFDTAVTIGRDILRLMPDRTVAEEYREIEPHLLRRRAAQHADEELPLRIAH